MERGVIRDLNVLRTRDGDQPSAFRKTGQRRADVPQ